MLAAGLDFLYKKNTCDFSNGKLNNFLNQDNCDTLFVGSSRVLHMIDPNYFGGSTRVLGFQQKHLIHNTGVIDILLQEKKMPKKLLVVNVEVENFFSTAKSKLLEEINSLKYYYCQNDYIRELINRQNSFERFKFLSEVYRHNGQGWKLISYPMSGNCASVSENGYVPLHAGPNDSLRLVKSIIDEKGNNTPVQSARLSPLSISCLNKLKENCDRLGIELKLISAPFFKYNEGGNEGSQMFSMYCDSIGVEFQDFNQRIIPGLDDERVWYDNMHLNTNGVSTYSAFLKKNL